MIMEITEKLINEKCEALKAELLKLVKPKLENGKWYKYTDSEIHLVCFTDVDARIGFGFDWTGFNKSTKWRIDDLIEATPLQIQACLSDYAVSIGFKGKVKWLPLDSTDKKEVTRDDSNIGYSFGYNAKDDIMLYCNYQIYNKGKWATCIPVGKDNDDYVSDYHASALHLEKFLKVNNLKIVPNETNP